MATNGGVLFVIWRGIPLFERRRQVLRIDRRAHFQAILSDTHKCPALVILYALVIL